MTTIDPAMEPAVVIEDIRDLVEDVITTIEDNADTGHDLLPALATSVTEALRAFLLTLDVLDDHIHRHTTETGVRSLVTAPISDLREKINRLSGEEA